MAEISDEGAKAALGIRERTLLEFRKWDVDGNGVIGEVEMRTLVTSLGFPEDEVPVMFTAADVNKDGFIDYNEFVDWVFTSAPETAQARFAVLLDGLDEEEDLSQATLSHHYSGEGFSKECGPEEMVGDDDEIAATATDERGAVAVSGSSAREEICARLQSTPFLQHTDPLFMHGRGYTGPLQAAKVTWASKEPPRKDHKCPEWLTATEYQDQPAVAQAKVQQLAQLLRVSRRTVLYTGAGISASVVGQAALSGQNKVGWKSKTEAQPTFTHYALGVLGQEGLIHSWVQQNHDGLPQKAGYPQENINEIHGSWYDPSNPVVKYSGSLRNDLYQWMREDTEAADLVLVLGTSLGGLNADQVPREAAERSRCLARPATGVPAIGSRIRARPPSKAAIYRGVVVDIEDGALMVKFDDEDLPDHPVALPRGAEVQLLAGDSLGTVCINLQQTTQDGMTTLRLFGTSDLLMRALLRELGISARRATAPAWSRDSRVLVPYDRNGRRLPAGEGRRMWLDLSDRQRVQLRPDHNIQGARQPHFLHIGASEPVTYKGRTRAPAEPVGTVLRRDAATSAFLLSIAGAEMKLGIWWLDVALRGAIDVLPLVNQNPAFEDDATPAVARAKPKAESKAKAERRPSGSRSSSKRS